jgi:hypothetical protein
MLMTDLNFTNTLATHVLHREKVSVSGRTKDQRPKIVATLLTRAVKVHVPKDRLGEASRM